MSRCPHCLTTKLIVNEKGNTKEVHNSSAIISTFVRIDYPYIEEPVIFQLDGILHEHDSNPIVATWRCKDGHEFEISGKRPCNGCSLERQLHEQKRRDEANQTARTQRSNGSGFSGNDHHIGMHRFNRGPDIA